MAHGGVTLTLLAPVSQKRVLSAAQMNFQASTACVV